MNPDTRQALIDSLAQIKAAKLKLDEAESRLRSLLTDLSSPVVRDARLDMSGTE